MISRHVSVCYALTCALLAILVCGCAPARAAPTATQGSAATLEVSQVGYELANTIPIGLSATNAQPYVSTEIDTEAEVAPTSLPMTNEEMALAEVAAVVAELATTAAAELKVREQGEDVKKEGISNSRSDRQEEDRQEVTARVLANVREAMEGVTVNDDDFIAATTFRTNLPQQINTTPITTTMSPATAQPTVPATATESPAILVELVRAAAAANEILAAALNVATMSVTNTNATMAGTTDDAANLATTLQPEAASSTTAVADHAQVSDSEVLPEPTAWQPNEFERLTEVTTAIPDYTTTPTAVEDKPTDNASVSIGINDDKLLAKELESIRQSQTATPIDMQETTIESTGKSTDAETTDLSKVNGLRNTNEEPKRTLADEDKEASESMIIEKSKESHEIMASPPPSGDNDLENSSPDAENLVINTTDNVATQTEAPAESATEVTPVNETAEIEALKKEQISDGEENVTEHAIKTTTTESLETLIAVESEARVPSKIVLISEDETLEQTTATTPEQTTIMSESILATDETTTTTTTAVSTEEDLLTETGTIEATTYTTVAPTILITTAGAQEESISSTESADIKTGGALASKQSEQLVEAIAETTAPPGPTVASNSITESSDENKIVSITTTKLPAAETTTTTTEEELSTSPHALTENHKDTVQYSLAGIETTTNSIEEPITVTRIPFIINTSTQRPETTRTTTELLSTESSRSSIDAPSLHTITTQATEEIQHLEASANEANFEAFPNADMTKVSPQTTTQTTDDITTTTLNTSPETTTISSTTTASATQPPVIEDTILDFTKTGSTAELREQIPTTTEELLSTAIMTTEKTLDLEDAADPEAKTGTTTSAAIEEQPFQTSTEKEQQQVLEENDSAITTTNTIVTTEESTIEDADVTSSAAFETTSTTTADIATVSTPEVEVTTTVSTTTPEPDITTTTTTTTLSPMSLIVAEHEARSLDRTPPRVSRIVNEDGVEVLTGYSIVHHMHTAALAAALAAEGV